MIPLRAYSLPMVLMLMSILAAAGTAAVTVMTSTATATATMINRRQAFYACDGVGRAAMVKSREYIKTDATPTTAELQTAVCGSTTDCPSASTFAPEGFTVDTLTLSTTGLQACTANGDCASNSCQSGFCLPVLPLPNGPFRGMNARQTNVDIIIEATKVATNARCRIAESVTLGEIGLFQFFIFADGYTDLVIPPAMTINGRVHVNGDFCAYGSNNLKIDTVTASGSILSGTHCPRNAIGATSSTNFNILDSATSTYRVIGQTNDHTCTTCTPSPPTGSWKQYAQTRWSSHALDSSHAVPELRLPIVGTAAVHDGLDVSGGAVDNSLSLKMLLDPVQAGDNGSVRSQRYASKADIVIINGIWFKRATGVPWPGTPIWSDHPGVYTTNCANDEGAVVCADGAAPMGVGQATLFTGTKPSRYSYYRHDGAQLTPDYAQRPVVSYGPLVNGALVDDFLPAFWDATATTLAATTTSAHVLEGMRSGFKDFRVDAGIAGTEDMLLPMNFDLAAFTAALQDTDAGELGAHFPDGVDADTAPDFNGIIYITNTWPNWNQNMSTLATAQAVPPLWPRVDDGAGVGSTAGLAASANGRVNQRLPYNVCKTDATVIDLLTAGPVVVPACADASLTRPNAVRFINGGTISTTVFPIGLTIATNQGVYIAGDLNSASALFVSADAIPQIVPVAVSWRPLMIGGDAITLLSNNWSDAHADWIDPRDSAQRALRVPTTTMWAFSSISGSVETSMTAPSGGINNFPRFLENWGIAAAPETRIFGSLVIGFRSSYQWQNFPCPFTAFGQTDKFAYTAPVRRWVYDTTLNLPSSQPPGTPSFFVQAIQTWKRE
jgi:hypothetical protein